MKAATKTTLLILIVLAIITLPQASATNTCTIRPAGTCQAGVEAAIASTSAAGNAHTAPTQGDCVIATTNPFSDYKAVASISDDGHLA